MSDKMYDMVLKNWDTFHEFLPTMREDQIEALFDYEVANKRRKSFILRLHQRFTSLRMARERKEIMTRLGFEDEEE